MGFMGIRHESKNVIKLGWIKILSRNDINMTNDSYVYYAAI